VEASAAVILMTAIKITIFVLMVSLGMETSRDALLQLWRQPRLLAGSLVATFVVVPLVAYGLVRMLPLPFGAKVGLFAISITPGAPMVYRTAAKRGVGNPELAASFQVTVAVLVIVAAPIWLAIVSALSGGSYWIPLTVVLKQVSTIQFVPVLIGMALHGWQPGFAERATPTLVKFGSIALSILIVVLLVKIGLRILAAMEAWTIIAAVLMAASAIFGGHLLAGPEPATRLTIANANAQRNAGLALTIAAWNVPEHQGAAVEAVVTYAIIALVMLAVYTHFYGRAVSLPAT
jgi:bile acid:Na+ symporter, BASS family